MFEKGNKHGGNKKVFQYELRKVLTQAPNKLREIAERLVACAAEGDLGAIRELADRLDGKAHQTIHGTFEHTVETGDAVSLTERLTQSQRARTDPTVQ